MPEVDDFIPLAHVVGQVEHTEQQRAATPREASRAAQRHECVARLLDDEALREELTDLVVHAAHVVA